jgi:hypothetical protein
MTCNGCGEKSTNRYGIKNVSNPSKSDLKRDNIALNRDSRSNIQAPIQPEFNNPFMDVDKLNQLSYSQIKENSKQFKKFFEDMSEKQFSKMNEDFKRAFFENLIDIINCTTLAPEGASPDQAASIAHKLIYREDFKFLEKIYPGVKEKLDFRQREFKKRCIEL